MNQFWMIFWLIGFAACIWVIISVDNQGKARREREKELVAQKLREEQEISQRLKEEQARVSLEQQRRTQSRQSYYNEETIENVDDDEDEYYNDGYDAHWYDGQDDDEESDDEESDDEEDDSEDDNKLEDLNNPHKKLNWLSFQEVMSENKVTCFYHFTDRANIPSIKKHGICAWEFCSNNSIEIVLASSSEQSRSLDKRDNLQNYVRVSFTKQHPMMFIALKEGRIKDPVILEISTEVALWKYTKYADRNAVKNGAKVGDNLDDFKRIRFDLVKKNKHFDIENEEERQFYQAELLILDKIPVKYINNINSL